MVLEAIQRTCSNYYEAIPQGAAKAAIKSAVYSFTISLSFRYRPLTPDIHIPLIAAGMAATASLIHALTAPIFKYAFEGHSDLMHYQGPVFMFDILVIHTLMNQLTSYKFELFLPRSNFIGNFSDKLILTTFKTSFYICNKLFQHLGGPPGENRVFLEFMEMFQTREENSIYFFI